MNRDVTILKWNNFDHFSHEGLESLHVKQGFGEFYTYEAGFYGLNAQCIHCIEFINVCYVDWVKSWSAPKRNTIL